MITYVDGDLFQSPAKVLVNTVNTVGVMGKGIAYEFKRIYPDMFAKYQTLCEKGLFDIGQLWLYKTSHKWILNFPTKKHWRNKSRPEYIAAGLEKFVNTYDEKGITSVSFPMLGCGNGELDWDSQVKPLMEKYLRDLPIPVYIHTYNPIHPLLPEHRRIDEITRWLHKEPQTLAFGEFWDDLILLVSTSAELVTLDRGQRFNVMPAVGQEGFIIQLENKTEVFLEKPRLLDLWQYIRSVGYCMPQNFPAGLDVYSPYLVGLLTRLEYISPVRLTNSNNGETYIGLQLIPASTKTHYLDFDSEMVIEST